MKIESESKREIKGDKGKTWKRERDRLRERKIKKRKRIVISRIVL